tara:strand:+ start:2266 stop:2817 length:552 start_codon:yes stop_codon:yes gene_type:complete
MNYADKEYWDDRYLKSTDNNYEWYFDSNKILDILKNTNKSKKILIVGCGNSNLGECLYDAGYENIYNVDFSEVIINEQIKKNISRPNMKWFVRDVTNMTDIASNIFDIILDKGTADSIIVQTDKSNLIKYFEEMNRLLKKKGLFFLFSLHDYICKYISLNDYKIEIGKEPITKTVNFNLLRKI